MCDTESNKNEAHDLREAVYAIMEARLQDKLDNANRLATKRSGSRGKEARSALVKVEKEVSEFKSHHFTEIITSDMVDSLVPQVYENYQSIDREELVHRITKIVKGLGFTSEQLNSPIATLSGGWRMKIALAKSLFVMPDVLLLDEPTNHLDLHAILWLREYIKNETSEMIVVVVSHDREFLSNVTDETIILKDKQLKYFAGTYHEWEINTEEQRIRKQTLLDVMYKKRL